MFYNIYLHHLSYHCKKNILFVYSMIKPLKYHVFENIMENRAFALLEQMLHCSIIFSEVFKT